MNKKCLIPVLIVGISLAGIGFFAGTRYQTSRQQPNFGNQQRQGIPTNNRNRQPGGGILTGEITSLDNNTLTLKLTDGSSKIIVISDSTAYQQTTPAQLSSLAVGSKITVVGTTNTDGTTVAKTVMVGESMPLPPAGGDTGQAPPSAPTK